MDVPRPRRGARAPPPNDVAQAPTTAAAIALSFAQLRIAMAEVSDHARGGGGGDLRGGGSATSASASARHRAGHLSFFDGAATSRASRADPRDPGSALVASKRGILRSLQGDQRNPKKGARARAFASCGLRFALLRASQIN